MAFASSIHRLCTVRPPRPRSPRVWAYLSGVSLTFLKALFRGNACEGGASGENGQGKRKKIGREDSGKHCQQRQHAVDRESGEPRKNHHGLFCVHFGTPFGAAPDSISFSAGRKHSDIEVDAQKGKKFDNKANGTNSRMNGPPFNCVSDFAGEKRRNRLPILRRLRFERPAMNSLPLKMPE